MTISPVQLFAHDPASLLPQLKHHLPKSLPVYGCILSNSSSVPTSTSPGHHEPLSTVETSNRLPHAYATFPPSCLSSPPELFAIFVHLPPPMTWQVRFFCSAETRKNLSTSERQTALNLVKDAVTLHLEGPEETRMLGGMSTLWSAGVREMLGTRENEVCDVWLAPEDGAMGEGEVDKEGLEVDEGRRRDCELIKDTRDAQAPLEYYIGRMPYTTVIRPLPTPEEPNPGAVAWILTHADGDQGALYTSPEYRRRGLARWVTQERLKEAGKSGIRGFCYVFIGNEVSGKLWENMGWRRGWRVQWVYTRNDIAGRKIGMKEPVSA